MTVVRPFLTVPFHVIPGFPAFFGGSQLVEVIGQFVRPITTSYALRLYFRCANLAILWAMSECVLDYTLILKIAAVFVCGLTVTH